MSQAVTLDKGNKSAEALGHPSECTEPVAGEIVKSSDHSVTITNASGETAQIATKGTASMSFSSHAHDYTSTEGCHDTQSHTLAPDGGEYSSSISINGQPLYVVKDGVTTDPGSGGNVNVIDTGINNSLSGV